MADVEPLAEVRPEEADQVGALFDRNGGSRENAALNRCARSLDVIVVEANRDLCTR